MVPYGRRLTLALIALLVVISVSGAGFAYLIGSDTIVTGHGMIAGETGSTPTSQSRATETRPAAARNSVIPDDKPAASAQPPIGGPIVVALAPSAANTPHARSVADLISRYFTAINNHDYDAWLATVTTAQAKRDRDSWTRDYSTTRDSEVYISDLTPGDPMTVRMQFVSHQALEFAPAALPAECVRWDVTYQIQDEGVGLRVGTSAKKPAMASC